MHVPVSLAFRDRCTFWNSKPLGSYVWFNPQLIPKWPQPFYYITFKTRSLLYFTVSNFQSWACFKHCDTTHQIKPIFYFFINTILHVDISLRQFQNSRILQVDVYQWANKEFEPLNLGQHWRLKPQNSTIDIDLTPKIPCGFFTKLCSFWPSWKNQFFKK